jgi:peptidoglycan/LPS O-acetylase OafA/YrhL
MDNRNHFLDVMRFLAALGVAFFHFNESISYVDNPYRHILKLGYVGVPVFFVISGYCIAFSADRSKGCGDFLIRRFFRIYPPYLMSLVITLLSIFLFKKITGYNSVATLPKDSFSVICTLLLLTKPLTRVNGINWVYWTLTLEAIFYVFAGIARAFPERFRLPFFVALSLIGWLLPTGDIGVSVIFKYWPVFSLGICIYYLQKQTQYFWSVLLAGLNLWWLFHIFLMAGGGPYFYVSIFTGVCISLSFRYRMPKTWLSTLGDYSYSVYLLHVPVAVYLVGLLKSPFIQKHLAANMIFDIICYLVTLVFAFLFFKWVELPSIRYGKTISKRFTDNPLPSRQ